MKKKKLPNVTQLKLYKFLYFYYVEFSNNNLDSEKLILLKKLLEDAIGSIGYIGYSNFNQEKKNDVLKVVVDNIDVWRKDFSILHKLLLKTMENQDYVKVDEYAFKQFKRAVDRKNVCSSEYDREFYNAVYSFACYILGKPFTKMNDKNQKRNVIKFITESINECCDSVDDYLDLVKWINENYLNLINQ